VRGNEGQGVKLVICVMCVNKQRQIELDSRMLGRGKMRRKNIKLVFVRDLMGFS
jgi:hypothetical protein